MQQKDSTVHSGASNKGILFVIVGLCAGIILFLALYLLFDWRSSPSPASYADLTAHQPVVPENENAYTYFTAAAKEFYYPTNNIFFDYIVRYQPKPNPVDTNLLKEAILINQPTFELIKQGTTYSSCVPPEYTDYEALSRDSAYKLQKICWFLLAKTRLELASRQYQEATESCVLLFHFGDRLLQHPSSFSFFIMGCSVKGSGLSMARELCNDPNLPETAFEQLAALLDLPDNLSEASVYSIKMDRGTAFGEIERQCREAWLKNRGSWRSPLTSFHLKPNTTKRLLLDYCRQVIPLVPLTYAMAKKIDLPCDFGIPEGDFKKRILPNLEGRQLCAMALFSPYNSLPSGLAHVRNNFSATRIAIAYQRYLKKEGRPPESLTDLVPTYLQAVPRDAYDGQPFRYLPKEKLLYSVDKDLKDSKAVWWTEGKKYSSYRDQVYPLSPDARPTPAP